MLNLIRSIAALKADYAASKPVARKALDNEFDKRYVGLSIDSDDSEWIVSIHKASFGCAILTTKHKTAGVHATTTVRVPKQYICAPAALKNGYFDKEIDALKEEASAYISVKN